MLEWDKTGEHYYETGVDHGVLYPYTSSGVPGEGKAWNGLTSVSESPDGAEATPIYADNIKYLNLRSVEEYKGTIEAYTYPDEWEECDGSKEIAPGVFIGQQKRKTFGLSYRTKIGNDTEGDDKGYKLHMVYGASASPSDKTHNTVNDTPEAESMSWEFDTVPVNVPGAKPTASITINSLTVDADKLARLEAILYGVGADSLEEFSTSKTYSVGDMVKKTESSTTKYYVCKTAITTAGQWDVSKWTELDSTGPRLPMPSEIIGIFGTT